MRSDIDAERRLRLDQTVQYLLREHGGGAIDEAMRAVSYAKQISDQDTIDLFEEVLIHLRRLYSD